MAKKTVEVLSKEQVKKLKSVGIEAKDAADARKKLLKKLAEKDIDGVDDDPLEELIEMWAAMYEPDEEEAEEEEETEEEESDEESDDEDEEEEEDDDDSDNPEEEEYDELEEEEAEEEEEEKPVKKAVKKAAPAPVAKKPAPAVAKKPEVKKVEKKAAPKTAKKETSARGEAFDSQNEDHMALIEDFVDQNNTEETEVKVLKQGVTVFATLESAKKALFSFDRLKVVDGGIVGDLFFNALKGKEEVEENVEIPDDKEIKNFNPNLCFVSKVTMEEVGEILSEDLVGKMMKKLKQADNRAVSNRKKLEEKMKETDKSAKKPVAKAEAAPVKKSVAPVVAKKPVVAETKKPLLKKK